MTARIHAPPSTQTFDVAVIGPQVAGAVAGALLARRGYRVLAVEHSPFATGYVDGEYRLPLGPTVLPQLRHLPAAHAVLEELGLGTELLRSQQPIGAIQILAERSRLDLFTEAPRRNADITREFGSQGQRIANAIDSLLAREERNGRLFSGQLPLPATGFADRWRLRGAAKGLELGNAAELVGYTDHPLARGLKELWRLSNNLVEQESLPEPKVIDRPAQAALRPLAHWLTGLATFPGGEAGLASILRKRISASGGAVLSGDGAVIDELAVEGKQVAGLTLVDSTNRYRARTMIAALDTAALRELIPASAQLGRRAQTLEAVRTRSQLVTLNLVVNDRGLPPGLGEVAVALPHAEGRSIFIQIGPAEKAQGGTAEKVKLLTLAMQVPPQSITAGEEAVRKLVQELRRGAEAFLPFVGSHVRLESSPQLSAHDPSGAQRRLHPRLDIARARQLSVTGLPSRSLLDNVVLASHEVLPGLGLEGQFLSGISAATLIQKMAKKADPLGKQD